MIILDIEERKKKENRHTVRGFDNGTFTSEYLNMSKLFCWQLLLVGNFTFAIYVVLLIVGDFTFVICVVLLIVGNFDFACNVYSGLNNKLMFKTINAEFGTRLTDMFIYVHIVYNLF